MLEESGIREVRLFGDGFQPVEPASTRIIALAIK